MPPTKTKPNENTSRSVTTMVCYHGSSKQYFVVKGSDYKIVVDGWISFVKKAGTAEFNMLYQNFLTKHKDVLESSDFYRYIFAFTTEMFRNSYRSERYFFPFKKNLQQILRLGLYSKYGLSPLSTDIEKREKYFRDIETDRGIINCLYRETNTFCNCMKPFKIEATKMEKVGMCFGCKQEFLKTVLKLCNRCECVHYCSNKCMKTNWPFHKNYCRNNNNNNNNNNKTQIKSEE